MLIFSVKCVDKEKAHKICISFERDEIMLLHHNRDAERRWQALMLLGGDAPVCLKVKQHLTKMFRTGILTLAAAADETTAWKHVRLALMKQVYFEAGMPPTSRCPIEIVDGNVPLIKTGYPPRYISPAGAVVQYPNAYRRSFGKPTYQASTLQIRVGLDWLIAQDSHGPCVPSASDLQIYNERCNDPLWGA